MSHGFITQIQPPHPLYLSSAEPAQQEEKLAKESKQTIFATVRKKLPVASLHIATATCISIGIAC